MAWKVFDLIADGTISLKNKILDVAQDGKLTFDGNDIPVMLDGIESGDILTINQDNAIVSGGKHFGFGQTSERPANPSQPFMYYDTDNGAPVWWNGSLWVEGAMKKYVDGTPVTETGLSTYIPDFNISKYFEYILTQNVSVGPPTNSAVGKKGNIALIQDSTGGYDASWDSIYIFPNGQPLLGEQPGKINLFEYTVIASNKIYVEFKASI
jgi:hypothetical protein